MHTVSRDLWHGRRIYGRWISCGYPALGGRTGDGEKYGDITPLQNLKIREFENERYQMHAEVQMQGGGVATGHDGRLDGPEYRSSKRRMGPCWA